MAQRPLIRERDTVMAATLIMLLCLLFTGQTGFAYGAVACLVLGMASPRLFAWPARVWFGVSERLGRVVSWLVLAIIYFGVITPVGLLSRAFGRDPLRRRQWKASQDSAFIVRNHAFTPEDIANPF